jgi:hypothetical protein
MRYQAKHEWRYALGGRAEIPNPVIALSESAGFSSKQRRAVRVFPERWRIGRRMEGAREIIRARRKADDNQAAKVCSISGNYGKKT